MNNSTTIDNNATISSDYDCPAAVSRYIHEVNEVILKPYGYFYFKTAVNRDGFSYTWIPRYLNTLSKMVSRFPREFTSDRQSPTYNRKIKIAHRTPLVKGYGVTDKGTLTSRIEVGCSSSDHRWNKIKDVTLRFDSRTEIDFTEPLTAEESAELAGSSNAARLRFYKNNPLKDPSACRMVLDYPTYCTPLFTAQDARGVQYDDSGMDSFLSGLTVSLCKRFYAASGGSGGGSSYVRHITPPKVGWGGTFNMAKYILGEDYPSFVLLHRRALDRLIAMSNDTTFSEEERTLAKLYVMSLSAAMYPYLCYEHLSVLVMLQIMIRKGIAMKSWQDAHFEQVIDFLESSRKTKRVLHTKFAGATALTIDDLDVSKDTMLATNIIFLANSIEGGYAKKMLLVLFSRFGEFSSVLASAQELYCQPNLTKAKRALRGGGHFWGWSATHYSSLLDNAAYIADYTAVNPYDFYLEDSEDTRLAQFKRLIMLALPETEVVDNTVNTANASSFF